MASFVAGLGTLVGWPFLPVVSGYLHEVFPALLLSFAAYVGVSRRTEPRASEVLERLFRAEAERAGAREAVGAGTSG